MGWETQGLRVGDFMELSQTLGHQEFSVATRFWDIHLGGGGKALSVGLLCNTKP